MLLSRHNCYREAGKNLQSELMISLGSHINLDFIVLLLPYSQQLFYASMRNESVPVVHTCGELQWYSLHPHSFPPYLPTLFDCLLALSYVWVVCESRRESKDQICTSTSVTRAVWGHYSSLSTDP